MGGRYRTASLPLSAREVWLRLPNEQRAGTVIDWGGDMVIPIFGPSPGGKPGVVVHGYLDQRQRVYQSGGELRNFMYWKEHLISLDYDVWNQVAELCPDGWTEMVDHDLNRCYRIDHDTAARRGRIYDAGIGPRWGVPDTCWDLSQGVKPWRPLPSLLKRTLPKQEAVQLQGRLL